MSQEAEIATIKADLAHLTRIVTDLVESHKVQDGKLDEIITKFTLGRSIASFLVKVCIGIGTVASALVFFAKEILPHITIK